MKTMICLILDRSGSMQGQENDVVGGVNKFLLEQQALPDPACIAFVRFDTDHIERFRPMQNLTEAKPLTRADYEPRGGTPLLDAVGQTITQLDEDWKRERPERCIVMIVTDGEENSSREYTRAKVKALIQARQASNMWAFIYLGANVDAFAEAGSMGIATANTAGYTASAAGTSTAYTASSGSVKRMRATGATFAHNLGVSNLGEDEDAASAAAAGLGSPKVLTPGATAVPPAAGASAATVTAAWTPPVGAPLPPKSTSPSSSGSNSTWAPTA